MNKYFKQIQASFATKLMLALLILLGSSTAALAGVTASIKDFSIAKGETKTVAIQIDNDVDNIRGFQGDIYLSPGLEFVKFEDTNSYASIDKTSGGRWTSKHSLTSSVRNDLDGKPLRVAIVALSQGKYLKGTSGDVVTFQVIATDDLPDEGATIELKDSKADTYVLSAKATVSNSQFAPAKVEMSVDDIVLNAGESMTLPINLDNETAITGVQATVTLPEGLEFVKNEDGDLFSGTARWTDHMANDKGVDNSSATMLLMSLSSAALKGDNGPVATFTVKANEKFVQDGEISFTQVKAVTPKAQTYPIADFKVKVMCIAANIVFTADDIEIAPSESRNISINLSNSVSLSAVQGSVILPKGLSIVPNDEDEFFSLTERATDSHMIDGRPIDGGYSFMLYSLASNNLKGNEGPVISFTVKADGELAEKSTIKFTKLVSVTSSAVKYTSNDFEIAVSNSSIPAEVEAQTVIDELSQEFADAQAVVDQYSETVQSRMVETEEGIASDIAALQTLLDNAKLNGTGVAALASIKAEKETISGSIAGYLADAAAKEEAWLANEDMNKSLVASIANVEAEFDAASQIVSAYTFLASEDVRFKSAQDETNASQAKIKEAIANAKSAAEEAYKAETSVKSEADILALLTEIGYDIKSYQKVAESQEATFILTTNLDKIAVVEEAYQEAAAALESYPFYAEKFNGYEEISAKAANAKTAIDGLEAMAKAVSDAESVTTQEEFDNAVAAAQEMVDAIIPAAEAAEVKYQAYLANEAMYASFTEKIAALESANSDAAKKVAALPYMSSNAAAFAEAQAATSAAEENILQSIADAKAKAEASHKAETAVKDEAEMTALFTSIENAIKKYVSDAEGIEAQYQAYLANEAMYASFTEKIAALESANSDAAKKVTVLPFMSSNAAAFAAAQTATANAEENILQSIADVKAQAKASYEAGTAVDDEATMTALFTSIENAVKKYVSDAEGIEAQYQAYLANEVMYASFTEKIAALESANSDAAKKVAALPFLSSNDAAFAEAQAATASAEENILKSIADAQAQAQASYKAATAVKDEAAMTALLASIENAIKMYVSDAEGNEAKYQAYLNEAMYSSFAEKIAELESANADAAKKVNALPFMNDDAAAVAEAKAATVSAEENILQSIADAKAKAQASFEAGTAVNDEAAITALFAPIEEAIVKYESDAKRIEVQYEAANANQAMYSTFVFAIEDLETANGKAAKKVNELSFMTDDAASFATAKAATISAEENILQSIADAKAKAQASFEAGTAVDDEAAMTALFNSIDEAIKKYVSDAEKIEAQYKAANANEAMFLLFNMKIENLESSNVEAAKKVSALPFMSSNDAAFAEYQTAAASAEDNILKSIADVKAKAQASYEAGTAVNDEAAMTALFTSIENAIKKYDSDAEAAEAKYQAYLANEAMYASFTQKIAALETANADAAKKVAALSYMNSDAASIAAAKAVTVSAEENILKSIANAKAQAQASYEAGTAVKEEGVMASLFASIDEAIKKYVSDARNIEAKFVADNENEAMYSSFNAKIADLESANDAAVLKVSEFDYMASDDARFANLQASSNHAEEVILKSIDYVKVQADAAYAGGTAVEMESVIMSLISSVEKDIEEFISNAEKNERKYIDTNNLDKIVPLQAAYDKAVKMLDSYSFYADKAYGYEAVAAKVAEGKAALEALNAMALAVTDPESPVTQADYDKSVADAQAFVAEFASVSEQAQANYVAYEIVSGGIDDAQAALDAEIAVIAKYEASVQEDLAEEIAALQKKITDASDALEAANKSMSVPSKADSMMDSLNSILAEIDELAQKAKEMNDIALGVDSLDASAEAVEYYSISGAKLSEPAAGQFNLIKFSNGTVKKVFVE